MTISESSKPLTKQLVASLPSSKLGKEPTYSEQATVSNAPIRTDKAIIPPYSEIRKVADNEEKLRHMPYCLDSDIVYVPGAGVTENGLFAGIVSTITAPHDMYCQWLQINGMMTVGLCEYYRIEIRIRYPSSTQYNYIFTTNMSGNVAGNSRIATNLLIPMYGMLIKEGYHIELHARRQVSTGTAELKWQIMYDKD